MFAGRQRLQADLDMRGRDGEVENDLDLRVGEQRVDRDRPQVEFRRPRLRGFATRVGERDDLQDREGRRGLQIGGADVAAADKADSHWGGHGLSSAMASL